MIVIRRLEKQKKKMQYSFDANDKSINDAKIGVAVDIGTTTVAMTVISLCDGRIIGSDSQTNEQTKLGADVMMRIMHAISGRSDVLHQTIILQIEKMAKKILGSIEHWKDSDVCFAVVGNTTMCHLFLDLDVSKLAGAPFAGAYTGNYRCIGKDIGMELYANSKVMVLSNIKAHVGSDALAMIGALGMQSSNQRQLAIDLGTNAEIVLNDRGSLKVCSTAAGPAFEGKSVTCGMPAKKGAINGVRMAAKNGNIMLGVLEDHIPKGISGTGLVDALAQCKKCRVLKEDGYLLTQEEAKNTGVADAIAEQLVERKGQRAIVLYPECGKANIDREVYITQSDIRNLQLAKGAIQAGAMTLLRESGLSITDIDEVMIAGVLGSCMRPQNAVDIGLFPEIPKEKLHFAGNAAGEGAIKLLLVDDFAYEMEKKSKEIQHIELADIDTFQDTLLKSMNFTTWK